MAGMSDFLDNFVYGVDREPMMDIDGNPTNRRSLLRAAGFTTKQIESVGANPYNLLALVRPMLDEHGQSTTRLSLLRAAGFTIEQIIIVTVANHLFALLEPMVDKDGRPLISRLGPLFLDAHGQPTTRLSILQEAEFTTEQIVALFSHAAGCSKRRKKIDALSGLLNNRDISLYVRSNAEIVTMIFNLANGKSRSDHINLLEEILVQEELRENLIKYPKKLKSLVIAIEGLRSEEARIKEILSVEEMDKFCEAGAVAEEAGAAAEEPRAKRPRGAGEEEAFTFYVVDPGSTPLAKNPIDGPSEPS